jgi:hypothetical protein
MNVLNKPESARLEPEMLSRSVISCPLEDGGGSDPFAFVSALGYRYVPFLYLSKIRLILMNSAGGVTSKKFTIYRRGVQFQRGIVLAQIYQLFPVNSIIPFILFLKTDLMAE